jgi:hypothetical protein
MRKIINSTGQLLTGARGEQEREAAKFFNVIILIVIIIAHLLLLSLSLSATFCSSVTPFSSPLSLAIAARCPPPSTNSAIQQFSPSSFQEITLVTWNEFFVGGANLSCLLEDNNEGVFSHSMTAPNVW